LGHEDFSKLLASSESSEGLPVSRCNAMKAGPERGGPPVKTQNEWRLPSFT
ncbi:unnamed protein product, partial [Symbiodinium natans]